MREWGRKAALAAALLVCMAVLLWQNETASAAVRQGLALCARSVIPSLFPFFVVVSFAVGCGFFTVLRRLGLPVGAAVFLMGIVGGYPVGARTVGELYRGGGLARERAETLLTFCNNAGPSFIFAIAGVGVFGSQKTGLALYVIHILSALAAGGLLGGLAALLLYLHHFQLPYGVYLSSITPAVPLAHAFGRIGCFFAGCCYGIPYAPPIGICLKNAIGTAPTDIQLFPVQLLESGLDFLLAGLLQLCFRKRTRKTDVIPFYCIGYAGIRLFTERFRYDTERGIYFGLATSEWISLALAICGVLLLLVPSLRRKKASHS